MCLSGLGKETEILTGRGWQNFSNLTKNDLVATLNLKSQELEFQIPSPICESSYSGNMFRQRQQRLDVCTTPNHDILFSLSKKYGKLLNPDFEKAKNLKGARCFYLVGAPWNKGKNQDFFTLPSCEYENNHSVSFMKIEMEKWLRFMGWYLSDGGIYRWRKSNYRIILASTDDERLNHAERLLYSMGFNPTRGKKGVEVYSKQLFKYLEKFGGSKQKYIPTKTKNLSSNLLEVLLESLLKGDGSKDGKRKYYWTSSKKLADDVQEIALKCGYSANISKRKSLSGNTQYKVNISPNITAQVNNGTDRTFYEHYEGKIYCCNVPNGVILVRRSGKPYFVSDSKFKNS